ncbi:hypothetical protein EG329_003924 [Mollisiaceae sp. DMI_Dod_QoI]|nr:hypothetical protein EG329_003924 [Helotiales sp. DMI_Dod_QoI]
MATCKHEQTYMKVPPTLNFLVQNFPYVPPNQTLDRSIPRCKLCDLILAQDRANVAENPPPHINVVEGIESNISLIEEMITAGIATNQDEEDLVELKKELEDAIMLTDIRIQEAWMPYWAIWGPDVGPPVLPDNLFDDGEDLIDWGV